VQDERENFYKNIRKASVDLLGAKVPHSTIRSQLKMLKSLWRGPGLLTIMSSALSSAGCLVHEVEKDQEGYQ
jgi:hypothetical protein